MDAAELYVERFIEPTVGMPLLGVGGYCIKPNARIEVWYDAEVAAVLTPSATDGHFSTQLPIEPTLRRVKVMIADRIVFEAEISTIRERDTGVTESTFLRRGLRSFLSGEALSPTRLVARWDRFSEKMLQAKQKLRRKLLQRRFRPCTPHEAMIARTDASPKELSQQRSRRFRHEPVISIVMPVYNVEPQWFRAAVASVRAQTYSHWELCIADDASTRVDLLAEFDRLPADSRIRFVRRPVNGHICQASNSAADLARGEYIALLDHDDALAPNALFEVVQAVNTHPAADLFYSDEDKIDAANRRYDPQHKPAWSPELLLSYNYFNHFTVLRRSVFESVGRFRCGYEGSQDHDLLLRSTEFSERVVHIPKILYHWRSLPTSTASTAGVKTYVHTSGRRAVQDALARRKLDASLTVPAFARKLGLPVLSLDGSDYGPSVTVIGPEALRAHTAYRNVRFEQSPGNVEYIVFIAAGLTPTNPRWLSQMVAYARIPGVGAVGGRVNPSDVISYYFYDEVGRNTAALQAGVILTRRDLFERLGSQFTPDFVDRMRGLGLRCVHVGDATFHGDVDLSIDPREGVSPSDPYANPHLGASFTPTGDAGLVPLTPNRPLKVFVAAHNLNSPEGAPRYLSEIVFGLRGRGAAEPVVVSPFDGAGAAVYREAGVPVAILDAPWARHILDAQWSPRSYEAAQNDLIAQLKKTRPDVVLANTLLMFPVVEAAARLGIPAVWILHESYSGDVLARLFTPYARNRCERAFALATRIIPASHETAALFRRCDVRHAIRVIHNGIDPASIDRYCRAHSRGQAHSALGLDDRKIHIIAVGTACERKGQHTLVEAAALLKQSRRDFVIHVVGLRNVVPYSGYLRQLVTRRNVADFVDLVPETNDVFAWYRAADVFACTSHMETFSRAILEAEAFGLPIISTPCHGVDEQVVWNQNALPFPFHDAARLAAHLETLIGDESLRRMMGEKSRAVFDKGCSFEEMLDRYHAVLQQAAGVGAIEIGSKSQRRAA